MQRGFFSFLHLSPTKRSILFIAFFVIVIFAPLLFLGYIPLSEERFGNLLPLSFFYSDALRHGTSYYWNPYLYAGFPTSANLMVGALNPIHRFIFTILPALEADLAIKMVGTFLALVAAYAFGRANRFSQTGSLLITFAYLTGSLFDGLNVGVFSPYNLLSPPAFLLFVLRARNATSSFRRVGWILGGGAVIALAIISGHPQMVLYALLLAGAYSVFLDTSDSGVRGIARFRGMLGFSGMIALAAIAAAPQLFHTAAIAAISIRTGGYGAIISVRPTIFNILWGILYPIWIRIPYFTGYLYSTYLGALTLVFTILAIVKFRNRMIWFFVSIYALLFALAVRVPILSDIHDHLPLLGRLPSSGRWLVTGSIIFATVAAYGYDRLSESSAEWRSGQIYRNYLIAITILTAIAVGAIVIVNGVFAMLNARPDMLDRIFDAALRWRHATSLPREQYRALFDALFANTRASLALGNWRVLAPVLFYPAVLAVLFKLRRATTTRWLAPVVIIIMSLNAYAVLAADYRDLLVPRSSLTNEPRALHAIREHATSTERFRVLPILFADTTYRAVGYLAAQQNADIYRETLTGQISGIHGIENLYGIEPMRSLRQHLMINELVAPEGYIVFNPESIHAGGDPNSFKNPGVMRKVTPEEKINDFLRRRGLLSMLGVRFILSPLPLPDPALRPIPMEDAHIPLKLFLYENPDVFPRAYFAPNPTRWTGTERDLLLAINNTKDFKEITYLECTNCAVETKKTSGVARVEQWAPGDVTINVSTPTGGWAVFAESALPGWRASVDGKPSAIATANFIFQAVAVPPGEHVITWRYERVTKLPAR